MSGRAVDPRLARDLRSGLTRCAAPARPRGPRPAPSKPGPRSPRRRPVCVSSGPFSSDLAAFWRPVSPRPIGPHAAPGFHCASGRTGGRHRDVKCSWHGRPRMRRHEKVRIRCPPVHPVVSPGHRKRGRPDHAHAGRSPMISIVIPARNDAEALARTLDHLDGLESRTGDRGDRGGGGAPRRPRHARRPGARACCGRRAPRGQRS